MLYGPDGRPIGGKRVRPTQPDVPVPADLPRRPPKSILLVTLLCPKCRSRVAVMDHFPRHPKDVKPGDITYIDGRTATDLRWLICPNCHETFPPHKARFPEHVLLKPEVDPVA